MSNDDALIVRLEERVNSYHEQFKYMVEKFQSELQAVSEKNHNRLNRFHSDSNKTMDVLKDNIYHLEKEVKKVEMNQLSHEKDINHIFEKIEKINTDLNIGFENINKSIKVYGDEQIRIDKKQVVLYTAAGVIVWIVVKLDVIKMLIP